MMNLKTLATVALLACTANVHADEIVVDTNDLHAAISAQLAEGLEAMQQDLNDDVNAMLVATESDKETTANVQHSE
ncbi:MULTISPECIES: hypothetical protein [Shewanella]|uniref:hypothetical protein n=1 Tax=Shewanella TaxID=22 RepID=UPI00048DF46F|nr:MULTISPECIES: hypothetical protein [Shewanella]QLE86337.1 hypothetical protein FLM48_15400 [Shewanella sp. Scap07]